MKEGSAISSSAHTNTTRVKIRAGWAHVGALLGGAISIAANIAHSFVPPTAAPVDWEPQTGAVVGSMFWPILLFVGVEILATYRWPKGPGFALLRFGGLIPILAVTGVVSYRHQRGLLLFYGEDLFVANIGPLAVDGLMVMATAALLATRKLLLDAAASAEHMASAIKTHTHTQSSTASTNSGHQQSATDTGIPSHLVNMARYAAENHTHTTGRPIQATDLAARMNITHDVAAQLLASIAAEQSERLPVLNGQVVGGGR